MQYLSSQNGNYQFRARIPLNLYPYFNRREIKRSLQTKCYNTAKSLNKRWTYHYDKLLQRLSMNVLSDTQIELYVEKFLHSTLKELESERIQRNKPSNNMMDELDLFEEFRKGFKEDLQHGRYEGVKKDINDIFTSNAISIDKDDITYKKLARELIKARMKILDIEEQRSAGNYDNEYDLSLQENTTTSSQTSNVKIEDIILLKALCEDYIEERSVTKKWDTGTLGEVNYIFNILLELIGPNRDISTIEHKELVTFRNSLLKLPKHISKIEEYKDKAIQDLVDLDLDGSLVLSITTVNKYIGRVTSLFDYALKRGKIGFNPSFELNLKNDKKEYEERDIFDDDDLKDIFSMPIYTNKLQATLIKKPEHVWIPLFGLYQGMRLNEICQLYKEDIIKKDGIWCIDINKKLDKRLKNEPSRRTIPIHLKLLEFGFIEYLDALPKESPRIWQNLNYTKDKGYSNAMSKVFSRLKNQYVTQDSNKVFHSFRHNVANHLKQILEPERVIESLLGHANNSMSTSRYGKAYKPQVQFDMLKKLEYNIDFPFENLLIK